MIQADFRNHNIIDILESLRTISNAVPTGQILQMLQHQISLKLSLIAWRVMYSVKCVKMNEQHSF